MTLSIFAVALLAVVEWTNLDAKHRLGGRKVSEGYLQGKTVMICKDATNNERMEAIWDSFKTRPFVMIGSFDKAATKVTFPMYRGAELKRRIPKGNLYVVDPTGKIVYHGDDERLATDIIVSTLTGWEFPNDEAKWKRAMAWEVNNAPAHAVLRYNETAKEFPNAATNFTVQVRAFGRPKEMQDLVKLVKMVCDTSDYFPKDETERKELIAKIKEAIEKYSYLKKSLDPQVMREAKNAIADLTWYIAEI